MTYQAGYFVPTPHRSQYGADSPPRTRREGCVPTTGANGANASTGGRVDLTGAQVHRLVPQAEETNPNVPGWSLGDLDLAMARMVVSVPFESRSGHGWDAVIAALGARQYVALQGDSDQFPSGTCSGDFDGNHCVGVDPASRVVGGRRQRWINDPLCPDGRWEFETVLRAYAMKLYPNVLFGVWLNPVPKEGLNLHIAKGATVRVYTLASSGCIKSWTDVRWPGNGSHAPVYDPPGEVHRKTCDGDSGAWTVRVKAGAFAGRWVQTRANGVTVS